MLYHFTFGSIIEHFKEVKENGYRIGNWWEYLCCFVVIALGYIFLSAAIVEKVEFNKRIGILKVERIAYGWGRSKRTFFLSDIDDIKVIKLGSKSRYHDTLHYMVYLEFRNREP